MPTEQRFYHLTRGTAATWLPGLLDKALKSGRRAVVRVADARAAERLAQELWLSPPDQFLPHGTDKDGFAGDQPIWITEGGDAPNGAQILFLLPGAAVDDAADSGIFSLICTLVEEGESADLTARLAAFDSAQTTLTHWRQNERGWVKDT